MSAHMARYRKMFRDLAGVDPASVFENASELGLSLDSIRRILDLPDKKALDEFCRGRFGKSAEDSREECLSYTRAALLSKMHENAIEGNQTVMQIFLAKNELGMTDRPESLSDRNVRITVVNDMPAPGDGEDDGVDVVVSAPATDEE